MKKLMPQSTVDISSPAQSIAEEVNLPATDHPGGNGVSLVCGCSHANVRFTVADKNGGLVAKLRESFFNYLRNRAL